MARLSRGDVLTVSDAVGRWLGPIDGHGPITLHDGVEPGLAGNGKKPGVDLAGGVPGTANLGTFSHKAVDSASGSDRVFYEGKLAANDWYSRMAASRRPAAAYSAISR